MTSETAFFSYSRTDSEFALNLAKDLRMNGAKVWLDQLDIKPGARWDASVENAMKSAGCVIVILSPASAASNNVMDEIAFALESNKTVYPVLLKACDMPFRLRRFQWADFTRDYQTGLSILLSAMNVNVPQPVTTAVQNTFQQPGQPAKTAFFTWWQTRSGKGWGISFGIIGAIALLLVVSIFLPTLNNVQHQIPPNPNIDRDTMKHIMPVGLLPVKATRDLGDGLSIEIVGELGNMVAFFNGGRLIAFDSIRDGNDLQENIDNIVPQTVDNTQHNVAVKHGSQRDLVYAYAIINDRVYRSPRWRDKVAGVTTIGITWVNPQEINIDHRGRMVFNRDNFTWTCTPGEGAIIEGETRPL